MNSFKISLMIMLQWALSFFLIQTYASNPEEKYKHYDWAFDRNISNEVYMDIYRKDMQQLDIRFDAPENFKLINTIPQRPFWFCPNREYKSDITYGALGTGQYAPPYISTSGDAIVLYPLQIYYQSPVIPDIIIELELIGAHANDSLDCTDLVRRIPGNQVPGNTNADWVTFYEYEVAQPIEGKYRHCVGIALRKWRHHSVCIKLIMSDDGLKNKEEYIGNVLNSIRYGNTPLEYLRNSEKNVTKFGILEGVYPRCLPELTKMRDEWEKRKTPSGKDEKYYKNDWIFDREVSNEEYMNLYRKDMQRQDVQFNALENFKLISTIPARPYSFAPNWMYKSTITNGSSEKGEYTPPYISNSGDAIVLYPLQIHHLISTIPDYNIELELIAANGDDNLDCTNLVKRIPGDRVPGNTNADWVSFYEYEVAPIEGKYKHCLGIALRKWCHFPVLIKLIMSDEGLKNKDIYINNILNSIRYGNTPFENLKGLEKRVTKFGIEEGVYPRCIPEKTIMENLGKNGSK